MHNRGKYDFLRLLAKFDEPAHSSHFLELCSGYKQPHKSASRGLWVLGQEGLATRPIKSNGRPSNRHWIITDAGREKLKELDQNVSTVQ